ncbi:sphingomyelin phosphodiesterase [Nocardioides sp. WS12]|uniref:sphingomyelin phosphodiesterase n=1 Tax=Nocardioides sp. WS12 TaxID=2486272 RepID=UPI0015FC2498|nr:sphingomyelin phosphodiesterase [Nocardioides sp. WS12]
MRTTLLRTALVTLASVALAATSTVAAPLSASADETPSPGPFRVLTHNVMFLAPLIGGMANPTRANLIAESDYVTGYDVVALNEAFDNGPTDALMRGLAAEYPHQTPVLGRSRAGWDQTLAPWTWHLTPEDGGVTVLSKWPIIRQVQYVYGDGCGFDALSNKGFVHVTLDVRGQAVHVVASHTQADDSLCSDPAAVRASQFAELDAYLDGQHIASDEPVVIAGDLNVDRATPEYAAMLAATDTIPPTSYDGEAPSFDPAGNSLTAHRYPGLPGQDLDYVLLRRTNQLPGPWTNTVLTPTSPPWTSGGKTFDDYSDHYPVAGG